MCPWPAPSPTRARGWPSASSRHPRAEVSRSGVLGVGTLADSGSQLERGVRAALRAVRSVPRGRSTDRELPAALSRGLRQELVLARRPEPGDARRWPWGTAGLLRSALYPPVKPGAPRPFFSTDSFVGIEFGSLTLVEWGQVNIICNFE